ncbi:MAG: hypothetical protein XE11_0242 [Methanomicrobiales archaeon 53_19]|jgi:hypothetical protein|uniref:hypothetical protein n=1 Tax=Methanocalculus sp. TaxID=2004547 RepID=UPI00074AB1F5|nr:hypothetical protein [Methanocalculus sp.]KUL05087.1 MAG: hypothetical protein XE11_0242 [Methanomicrobiales archaeon 53_19]HIJ07449.1 hypothetical protein [Methanocalculus sp.]
MTDTLITLSIGKGMIMIIVPIVLIGLVLMYLIMRRCLHEGICSCCTGRNKTSSYKRSEEGRT